MNNKSLSWRITVTETCKNSQNSTNFQKKHRRAGLPDAADFRQNDGFRPSLTDF